MANMSRTQRNTKKKRKAPKGRIKHQFKLWQKILLSITGLLAALLVIGVGMFFFYVKSAPALNDKELDATLSSHIYAANEVLIEDLGAQKREKATAQTLPQTMKDAVVSVEDRRFYEHHGVDPIRIAGSFVHNIGSGGLQGGSTLTQQLIKLSYFSTKSSDQTLKRKAQEAWLATRLEKQKSKEDILVYYVNKVYMANGIYGMQTAAETYFGKPLSELDLAQSALLAGMPQAPTSYDPYAHPEAAKKRRDTVLYTMLENNKISQSDYDTATKMAVTDGLQPLAADTTDHKLVDNYVKEVINEVKTKTGKDPYTDGLDIYTNLDLDAQKQLYNIVNSDQYVQYPDDKLQVAATLMDVGNGKVTAQIGGRNIPDGTILGNNLAVNTSRDFGSTVKPITDYAPAFEYLKKSTGSAIKDEPYDYQNTNTAVNNWDNQYMGSITLRKALYESRNVPAVKLFNEVGSDKVSNFLNKLGIQYKNIEQANAISSNTTQDGTKYGISTEKLAAAYSALSNGGTYYEPQYISKIRYQDGTEQTFDAKGQKAMDPGTAYMVTDILKDVISQGTGTNAQISSLIQAGKTGTSNYTKAELKKFDATVADPVPDVMFTGYTPLKALSIWTGYNDRMTPITAQSSNIATDVYREMMGYLAQNMANSDWQLPSDLARVGNELYFKDANNENAAPQITTPSTNKGDAGNYNYYNNNSYSSTSSSSAEVPVESSSSSLTNENEQTPTSSSNAQNTNTQVPQQTTPSTGATESSTPTNGAGAGNNAGNGGAATTPSSSANTGNGNSTTPSAGNGNNGNAETPGNNTGGGNAETPTGNGNNGNVIPTPAH